MFLTSSRFQYLQEPMELVRKTRFVPFHLKTTAPLYAVLGTPSCAPQQSKSIRFAILKVQFGICKHLVKERTPHILEEEINEALIPLTPNKTCTENTTVKCSIKWENSVHQKLKQQSGQGKKN